MTPPTCIAFYGLRFDISLDEIEALELRTDRRIVAARKNGLQFYWGRFSAPDERYLLVVGGRIGIMGPENQLAIAVSDFEFEAIKSTTKATLLAAQLEGECSLHILWEIDE